MAKDEHIIIDFAWDFCTPLECKTRSVAYGFKKDKRGTE
jgi:hypothetical protein